MLQTCDPHVIPVDITNSFQRSYDKSQEKGAGYDDPSVPLWKKVDSRFWWNEHLTRDFVTQNVDNFNNFT